MRPTDLAFFSTLVRSGSLTAAAREYDVTTSAVSKWLAQLEARLGARLVTRTTRRVTITSEGELYLKEGRRILEDIDRLERSIVGSRTAPSGLLKVNATFGFGKKFIAPAISRCALQYPDLEIRLLLTDRPVSLADGEVDICVWLGQPSDTRVIARRIARHRRYVYAAPSYLKDHGTPRVPNDLLAHNCLIIWQDDVAYRSPLVAGHWQFTNGSKTETVKVHGTLSSNDGSTALDWALQGHGILMRSEWQAAEYVRRGQLVTLLDDYTLPPADIYAVYPQKKNLPVKVRTFVDVLAAHLSPSPGNRHTVW